MFSAMDNAAAALVLSHLLRRTPLDHPFGTELSVSWLLLNLRRALGTKGVITTGAKLETAFPFEAKAAALNDGYKA
jgi:hypothetical protein